MPTIYDVARSAGVSPKTVSRVINGDAPVNPKTRAAIAIAMGELGYVPSSAARAMRSQRSGLVGLVTGAISGRQAGGGPTGLPDLQIIQGIQRKLSADGLTVLISDTGGDLAMAPRLFRTLREHRVEGVFYVASHHMQIDLTSIGEAEQLLLVNAFDPTGAPCVLPDDLHGEEALTAALVAEGHRRIGFLTLPTGLVAHRLRLEGYRRALAAAGVAYDPALVIDADRDGEPEEQEALGAAIDAMMATDAPPTALLCGNDRLAITVYGLLRARGVAVPEQISVAGYDDYRVISETLYPRLTTMELPYLRMGEEAARLMLGALRGGEPLQRGMRVEVRGDLRWRDSVMPGPWARRT